ncbi:hypothetical protein IQ06DRAFT_321695 [Phaeosphaeriaceae sp. SRC1lsM3a]|nr:hypothetical protein IQ06DRAFT_321695 [Stagonospora sp. SRC1lsM3a]
MSSSELEHALHLFYPVWAIIKDYAASTLSSPVILVYFSALVVAFLLPAAYALTRARSGQGLPRPEFAVAMWFALWGYIHFAVESYFVFNHATLAADCVLFDQMWKEYALSDSRYLTSDTFTVCMETVTTPFYYYGYFIFLNANWLVIPGLLLL